VTENPQPPPGRRERTHGEDRRRCEQHPPHCMRERPPSRGIKGGLQSAESSSLTHAGRRAVPVTGAARAISFFTGAAKVNLVTLAALLLLLVAVHEWLFVDIGETTPREQSYLQLVTLTQCVFVTTTAAVVGVLVGRLRHAAFGFFLTIAPLMYVDALVRVRIDRHLGAIVGLLLDSHFVDNQRLLDATGVDKRALGAFVLAMAILIAFGTWVDWRTREFAARTPGVSRGMLLGTWLVTLAGLGGLEVGAARVVTASSWPRFARSVPQLLGDLAPTPKAKAAIRVRLRKRRSEAAVADAIARVRMPTTPPPGDVFVLVIDSLRADAIDPATAPALDAQSREGLHADTAVSGGDMTHYGWYALFWANPGLYWRIDPDPEDRGGPVPLRLAHRRGWRIDVLTAPDPTYLHLDDAILGPNRKLADEVVDRHGPGTAAEHDAAVIRELIDRIGTPHPPTVYLVFLDAVHLPYVWTDAFKPPFLPYADVNHYLQRMRSPEGRSAVRNRYLDAVAFVDSLVARFLTALHAAGTYDESTIVVLGDHGEELGEHGHGGHGSEPCSPQTHVAFSFKPPLSSRGNGDWSSPKRLASTMDVWPTILDAAGVRDVDTSLFYGTSMARDSARAALVTHQRSLVNPPARFVLDNGEEKVVFELSQPEQPFRDQDLYIVDLLDENDAPTHQGLTASDYTSLVRGWFASDLERFFVVRW
jgi:hypothetical protein